MIQPGWVSEPRRRKGALLLLALAAGCASQGMPPGGPPDKVPPVLLRITPESGALHVNTRQVVTFRFDEVVSERIRSGGPLEQGVVVSPSEGPVSVDWHRTYITVRNRKGWRPNMAYTVTILAGLEDLSNNSTRKPFETTFSTGDAIPHGDVTGVAFDWMTQQAAAGARIQATIGKDTALKYVTVADSTGRFTLTTLPLDTLHLVAYVDANSNRVLDPRELWDSSMVALRDTASRTFYMFAHDTIGPSLSDVTAIDTLTLRIHFDRPVKPGSPLEASQFSLKMRDTSKTDSIAIPIVRVSSAARYDTLVKERKLFVADSIMRADTTAKGRAALQKRDSIARAQRQDSIAAAQVASVRAARDTVKKVERPKPTRPAPLVEFILELGKPLPYGMFGILAVHDVVGLTGHVHHPPRVKVFELKKPAAKDSATLKKPPGAVKDSAALKKPPGALDAGVIKKPPPDTTTASVLKKP